MSSEESESRKRAHDDWSPSVADSAGSSANAAAATTSNDEEKEKPWGTRYLTDDMDVYEHNAWDNVEWDGEQEREAMEAIGKQTLMDEEKAVKLQNETSDYWNTFYAKHQDKFFKDRNWLKTSFPQMYPPEGIAEPFTVFEVGCGVGNTVFPLLATCDYPKLFVNCCDFSDNAIKVLQTHPDFNPERCRPFVFDLTSDAPFPDYIQPASIDTIVMIYVLSAIVPEKMAGVIKRLAELLKPGGHFLFRDYGRFDMVQLRFKKGRLIRENLYARGDGTLVYFFDQDEVNGLFREAGLEIVGSNIDRRLLVNRGKRLKMYRIWLQTVARKPINVSLSTSQAAIVESS